MIEKVHYRCVEENLQRQLTRHRAVNENHAHIAKLRHSEANFLAKRRPVS
jgi:hypothetical protein